ncbi:VPLPA-CTERM sorting domain-containing protein [Jannaschia sp. CCS1]|uniref:VPLPA-CTERM sorting domain-containing protein n=1 Tax=Jannaschia sp. (strain CCS1) TaxID=290400 RepID=UPI000053A013|nr:VPLPA-CTERM sorting domain-containing protein [Jannaschia sp. CCS1]ABD53858.1 hypothetical protein Jann_0941 [Jannaschia sp. CCS1]
MIKTILTAAALATLPMAAQATTLDFDLDGGTAVYQAGNPTTNVLLGYVLGGRTFSFSQNTMNGQASSGANLFDSMSCTNATTPVVASCRGNDDGDLVPVTQGENGIYGNVLIRQQASARLDDDAAGDGSLFITLDSGPAFRLAGFSAIDGASISLFRNGVNVFGPENNRGNRETELFSVENSGIFNVGDTLEVRLLGSGGVDAFQLAPVPLPAGVVLLLGALGGLGLMRRRATRAA